MAWQDKSDYIKTLQQGDPVEFIEGSGIPVLPSYPGNWNQAFPDTLRAARAAEALRVLHHYTDFDAGKVNWLDLLRPRGGEQYGASAKFGPSAATGDYYFSTSEGQSGGKCLQMFPASVTPNAELASPLFPLKANTAYRVRIHYKTTQTGAATNRLAVTINCFSADKLTGTGGFTNLTSGQVTPTNNVWTWKSFVGVTGADDRWGAFQIVRLDDNVEFFIDSLHIEILTPSWRMNKTTNQINVNAAGAQVTMDSFAFGYNVTVNTNDVTIIHPGVYAVGCHMPFSVGTAAEHIALYVTVNGAAVEYVAGVELARINAVAQLSGQLLIPCVAGDIIALAALSSASTGDIMGASYPGQFYGYLVSN